MNQRESSGLPLRAMVMVLLFLGVAFLLAAFNLMGSDDDGNSGSATSVATVTPTATSTAAASAQAPAKPEVRVYNISDVAGAAEGVATRLRDAQWNVTATENLVLDGVTGTTVYFGEAPGEKEAATEIGSLLQAPVEPRLPALGEQPPGVIVAVTG